MTIGGGFESRSQVRGTANASVRAPDDWTIWGRALPVTRGDPRSEHTARDRLTHVHPQRDLELSPSATRGGDCASLGETPWLYVQILSAFAAPAAVAAYVTASDIPEGFGRSALLYVAQCHLGVGRAGRGDDGRGGRVSRSAIWASSAPCGTGTLVAAALSVDERAHDGHLLGAHPGPVESV